MISRPSRILASIGAAFFAIATASCGLIAGVPSIGDGVGGGEARVTCDVDADCDDHNPCTTDTCGADRVCVRDAQSDGATAKTGQKVGDCETVVCKAGKPVSKSDPTDVPDDGEDCTTDSCGPDGPLHTPAEKGTACVDASERAGSCDGAGSCVVACTLPSECTSANPCVAPTCDATKGACVDAPLPDMTPTPGAANVPGDCHVQVCVGGVDTSIVDDNDVPKTATDCDEELCTSGVPSNPAKGKHNPCSTFMGNQPGFCDDAGACNECAIDADCPGTIDDCQHPVCSAAGACSTAFTAAMTPTTSNPPQVVGDCATLVCDGSGGTMKVLATGDPLDDGDACKTDTCAAIDTTTHPNAPDGTTCGAGNALACVSGACTGCTISSQCAPAMCMGTVLVKAQTCNAGTGQCVVASPPTQDCAPYLCNAMGCTTSCVSDAGCAQTGVGNYCTVGGTCAPKLGNGQVCGAANQCQSGFCVDGVCCNSACTGACQACSSAKKGAGASGACGAIAAGMDPDNECMDNGAMACGNDGFCDGAGACRKYAAGTVCQAGACGAGTTLNKPKTCNGSGSCISPVPQTQDCAPYVCSNSACTTTCTGDAQCASNAWCNAGACVAKLPAGSACSGPSQCALGFCVDGVCCSTACTGACQACSAALKQSGAGNGTCGNAKNGQVDPRGACVASPPCGNDGTCSAGACAVTPSGTQCQAASCTMATLTPARTCDGAGTCSAAGASTACPGSLQCNAAQTACLSGCGTQDANCVAGRYCDGVGAGTCQSDIATGAGTCGSDHECASNHCGLTNGICCTGTCAAQAPSTCGTTGACAAGTGACLRYDNTTACMATSCTGSTIITYTLCNGAGACSGGATTAACPGNFVCADTSKCFTGCGTADPVGDARCTSLFFCDGVGAGSCKAKLPANSVCTRGGECQSGMCGGSNKCL